MHILDFRNDPYAVPNEVLIGFLTSSYKVVLHRLINYSGVDRCIRYLAEAIKLIDGNKEER